MAAGNSKMIEAKRAKNDEFYTRIEDIESELSHYREHFRDKVVFLNCDDPESSNFWRYFELNFDFLGLKKLIATHYDAKQPTYKLELVRADAGGDTNGDGVVNGKDVVRTGLRGNGDFRSPEAIALLEEADIVITNPPFSLFREYVAQLITNNKGFVILGNQNALTYKEIWPLIQNGKMWLGTQTNKVMEFAVPPHYSAEDGAPTDARGLRLVKVPAISWFTNLDHSRRHEEIVLFRRYAEDPSRYPVYDNYDAIEVSKVADIPEDYDGLMGVPITFLGKHNPDQFEIVGQSRMVAEPIEVDGKRVKDLVYKNSNGSYIYPYMRVIIRRRKAATS